MAATPFTGGDLPDLEELQRARRAFEELSKITSPRLIEVDGWPVGLLYLGGLVDSLRKGLEALVEALRLIGEASLLEPNARERLSNAISRAEEALEELRT